MQHNLENLSKLIDAFYMTSSFWKYKHRRDDWVFIEAEEQGWKLLNNA